MNKTTRKKTKDGGKRERNEWKDTEGEGTKKYEKKG